MNNVALNVSISGLKANVGSANMVCNAPSPSDACTVQSQLANASCSCLLMHCTLSITHCPSTIAILPIVHCPLPVQYNWKQLHAVSTQSGYTLGSCCWACRICPCSTSPTSYGHTLPSCMMSPTCCQPSQARFWSAPSMNSSTPSSYPTFCGPCASFR